MASLGKFLKEHLVGISAFFTMIGIVLLIWALLAFCNVEPFSVGEYDWWLLLIGIIIVFLSAGYVIDYILKVRKFRRLLDTDKKSEFIKRHSDLEKLAARLSDAHKADLQKEKEHFHIK